MHKKWCFHDTPVLLVQNMHQFYSWARGRHVSLLGLYPYSKKAKKMVKSTVSLIYASFGTKNLEQRWSAPWSKCKQSCSTLLPHIGKAKIILKCMVSVLLKALCTLNLKWRGDSKWSNCVQIHVLHRKQCFPDTKVWNVQNVHSSVSCTVVSMKHVQSGFSCTIVSLFVYHISLAEKKREKHHKYDIVFYFKYVCAEIVTEIRMSVSQLCTRNDVSLTTVQLLQNKHQFASCAIRQFILDSSARNRKTW